MARSGGKRAGRPGGARTDGPAAARRGVVLGLAVLLPLAFSTASFDTVFLHKYTVLVLAALVLFVLLAIRVAGDRSPRSLANGLHWPVVAVVAWTAVTTATSISPRLSLLGFPRSFDGLVAAVAMALVFFVVAADGAAYARRLVTVVVGAGSVVVLYALVQLHDARLGGADWDPVDWSNSPFRGTGAIWSTFGNPNHLGGFLAMLLPLVVVLFVLRRDPRWRWGLGALGVATVVALAGTRSQGALLATVTGLFVAALVAGLVRGRLRLALVATAAAAALGASGLLALSAGGGLPGRVVERLDGDGKLAERSDLWRAGWQMALDRPVVGVGPDMYRVPFHRYQAARYVARNGPSSIPNGPHNLFVNTLANQGFPGLALLLALVAVAALRVAGAVRRLEREPPRRRPGGPSPPLEARLLLAGASGAVVAYFTESSFNANVLPLAAVAWLLLGLVVALTGRAGVPVTLDPRRLLAGETDEGEPVAPAPRRPVGARPSSLPGGVGIAAGIVALTLAWPATAPWRADRRLWDVWPLAGQVVSLAERGQPDQALAAAAQVLPRFRKVVSTNPVDPTYHSDLAELHFKLAGADLGRAEATGDEAARARGLSHLASARRQLEIALDLQPDGSHALDALAKLLAAIDRGDGKDDPAARAEAEAAFRRAIAVNRFNPTPVIGLADVYRRAGEHDRAAALLADIRTRAPRDTKVLLALADVEADRGRDGAARRLWRDVLALDPENEQAREKLTG